MSVTATSILNPTPAGGQQQQQPNNQGGAGGGGGGGGTQPAPLPTWAGEIKNPDVAEFLRGKNFPDLETALTHGWSTERLYGADKAGRTIIKPKDANDKEGTAAFRKALGVPDKAEDYKLPLPQGVTDDAFAKTASAWFHEAGVPTEAGVAIATKWNEFIAGEIAKGKAADEARAAEGLTRLKSEWGANFEGNSELARRGLKAIGEQAGLDEKDLTSLENAIGSDKMLKVFLKIGEVNRETPGDLPGNTNKGFAKDKASLEKERDDLTNDRIGGKIDDYMWRTKYGPRVDEIAKILSGG